MYVLLLLIPFLNNNNNTALHIACREGYDYIVSQLVCCTDLNLIVSYFYFIINVIVLLFNNLNRIAKMKQH